MAEVRKVLKFYKAINGEDKIVIFEVVFFLYSAAMIFIFSSDILTYIKDSISNFNFDIKFLILFTILIYLFYETIIDYKNNKCIRTFDSLPIKRDTILKANFLIICIPCTKMLIPIIVLFILNIYTGMNYYVTAFIGLAIVFYCMCFILLSFGIGFSMINAKKAKISNYVIKIVTFSSYMLLIFLSILDVNFGARVSWEQVSTVAGKGVTYIIKSLSVLGGFWGVMAISTATILGYFLSVKLPLRIFEKEG